MPLKVWSNLPVLILKSLPMEGLYERELRKREDNRLISSEERGVKNRMESKESMDDDVNVKRAGNSK